MAPTKTNEGQPGVKKVMISDERQPVLGRPMDSLYSVAVAKSTTWRPLRTDSY